MIVCSTEGVCEINKKAIFVIVPYLKLCLLSNNKSRKNVKSMKYDL